MKSYKKYTLGIAIISTIALSFVIGSHVGAQETSWSTKIITDAKSKISGTSSNKANELTADIQNTLADKLSDGFAGTVQQKQAFLNDFINNYFLGKLDGVKDTPEYKNIQTQIDIITDQELTRVKQQIDAAIANALK